MADTPDVLKRLEEIEHPAKIPSKHTLAAHVSWLLRLARALLESQKELIAALRFKSDRCEMCASIIARAERVRKGEV